jgi:CSLREA domain-containing protein
LRPGALAAALLLAAVTAKAATLTVNTSTDSNDGSCGTTCSLRDAVAAANNGDTIVFQSGLTGPITLSSPIGIATSLTITGPGANQLTISGGGTTQIFAVGSATVSISGLTFANGSTTDSEGGEIVSQSGSNLTISNCAFTAGNAVSGAAIYSDGGTVKIAGSTFSANTASETGGAIFSVGTAMTVTDSTFAGNVSNIGGGGAIYVSHGTLTVTNSTFYGNAANGTATFPGYGGAIENTGKPVATVTLANSIFASNTAFSGGAGVYDGAISAHLSSNIFDHNLANGSESDCEQCRSNVGAITGDTHLAPLGYYGGSTQTMILLPGSAAICAVPRSNLASTVTTDDRGFPLDPTCSGSPADIDAGAVQTNQYFVTNTDDSGAGTLRTAITQANAAGGDIAFAKGLKGTITLLSSLPTLANAGNLLGPGAANLTISGGNSAAVGGILQVNPGVGAIFYGLTIANGNSAGNGGGILNHGYLRVSDSLITGNIASTTSNSSGGGICNDGTLSIENSTIAGNTANDLGGGIENTGALTITNSTIAGNTAGEGGGIDTAGSLMLSNSTLANNTANRGGGVYNQTTMAVSDSIVAYNQSAFGGAGILNAGTATSASYNVYFDNIGQGTEDDCNECSTNTNAVYADPKLATLGLNGGSTPTMNPMPGSAAICAASPALVPAGAVNDQRGFPRLNVSYAGYSATSPCVDAGAVQTNYTSVQFVQQPGAVVFNTPFSPPPTVALLETNTNLATDNTWAVDGASITLAAATGTGPLTGNTATSANGVATFSSLEVTQPGLSDGLDASVIVTPATAAGTTTLSASSSTFNVIGNASKFVVQPTPFLVGAGGSFQFTVTAEDANGLQAAGYTGTVHFTSSDPRAVLPANSRLKNGAGTFMAIFKTSGPQTITATDVANKAITGTMTPLTVIPGPAVRLEVYGVPMPAYTGDAYTGTVAALDAYNNPTANFNGTPKAKIVSSDKKATIVNPPPFSAASVNFTVTFATTGTQSLTAASPGLKEGEETGIVVKKPAAFVVTTATDDAAGNAKNCPAGGGAAKCSLRDALAAAAAARAGTITFSAGVFATPQTIHLAGHGALVIPPTTSISGPTTGQGAALKNLVTVSGDGKTQVLNAGSKATNVVLSGLNIVNGANTSSGGGGLANAGAMTLTNMTFSANTTTGSGGGIYNTGTLTMTNCTISGNSVSFRAPGGSGFGGGIYNNSNLTVAGCTFSGDSVHFAGNEDAEGGAIFNLGTAMVADSAFIGNSAAYGGAILNAAFGGTIQKSGNLSTTNSTFAANVAVFGGGLYNHSGGTLTAADDTLVGNAAQGFGRASGGAIFNFGQLQVSNSIISKNLANADGAEGAGIYNIPSSGGVADVNNTVFFRNYREGKGAPVEDDCAHCTSISLAVDADPKLAMPANYGGATETLLPMPGSAAICAGNALYVPSGVITDQRGAARTTIYGSKSCVDAGAVQTHYGMAFAANLPGVVTSRRPISPAPAVALSENGALANGVTASISLSGNPAALSGTTTAPVTLGTATFTDVIVDKAERAESLEATLPLNRTLNLTATSNAFATTPIAISPAVLPSATVGDAYNETISAKGGTAPYSYKISTGKLPPGLTLAESTGNLHGKPTASGTFTFTVKVTDSSKPPGPYSRAQAYSIEVKPAATAIKAARATAR